ncbi:T9SS type A sorting domain-containing protein [Flavobacterium sp. NG2]|uniref:T9SS type A sorting domain-containing protein n=1 Tax=Flavobacterium sp. NG2 TaxID=3097547 RepID=UPI002A81EF80|nr:T9SS type A sorting domain-containing protein [Flavobacterium sp. NG2]WPR71943.1 T9SS type A sorting domain-containing protein [Flavobacterium sp. NG2]
MKLILKISKIIIFCFFYTSIYSQVSIKTVSPQNLQYTNSGSPSITLNNCGNIDLGTSTSTSINIGVKLTKPTAQAVGNSTLYVYTKKSNSDYQVQRGLIQVQSGFWGYESPTEEQYTTSVSFSINSSEFNVSGGTLYLEFVTSSNFKSTSSCIYTITKTQVPTFTLPVATKTIVCGATTPQTFAITNVYNSPNTTYQWSTSGWKYNGNPVGTFSTTASSISLTPNTSLPSNVTVTPIVNGVTYPSKTITVSLAAFNPYATITGSNGLCASNSTATYTLADVPANSSVVWSSSNPSVASISSQSTTSATVTINVTSGSFILKADITNGCGQTKSVQKTISITNSLPIPVTFGQDPSPSKIYAQYDPCVVYFKDSGNLLTLDSSNFEVDFDSYSDFYFEGVYGNALVLNTAISSPYLNLSFNARMKNDCGWGEWQNFTYFLNGYDPYYSGYSFRVISNPTSEQIEVTIDESSKKKDKTTKNTVDTDIEDSYTIQIGDISGNVKYHKENLKSKTNKITTSNWEPGVYYLKITNNKGESQNKGFIVK